MVKVQDIWTPTGAGVGYSCAVTLVHLYVRQACINCVNVAVSPAHHQVLLI